MGALHWVFDRVTQQKMALNVTLLGNLDRHVGNCTRVHVDYIAKNGEFFI